MMKSQSEMEVGERMIDHMTGEVAELSAHLCLVKMCKNNHFCSLNYEHVIPHLSLLHNEVCNG